MNALLIMAILFLEIISYKQDKPSQVELRKKKKKRICQRILDISAGHWEDKQ